MIYFTSDTHFWHSNVIKYSNRPFDNIEQMNDVLIKNWNSVVKPEDQIWHLGDFSFANQEKTKEIFSRLNGKINLVFGNHDQTLKKIANFKLYNYVESYQDYKELRVNNQLYVLMHYPLLSWNKGHYGSYHLHGHSHGTLNHLNTETRLDVGVDNFNYTPVSIEEVNNILKDKKFIPIDHHGK